METPKRNLELNDIGIESQNLAHFPIIAEICRQINLVHQVNTFFPHSQRKVSVGDTVLAMIVNGLAFASSPLYFTPEFYSNIPLNFLFKRKIFPDDLNIDSLGRSLDLLYQAGVTEIFAKVASRALSIFKIEHEFVHLDSTSFSVEGEYAPDISDSDEVKITYGYSKAHRPDLKQVMMNLICTYKSAIPAWLEVLNGNTSDKTSFVETIEKYIEQLESNSKTPVFVADSALYSAKNINTMSKIKWITRVPETLTEVRELCLSTSPFQMQASTLHKGYRYKEVTRHYADIEQRWIVCFSPKAYYKEKKTLRKEIDAETEWACTQAETLEQQEFETAEEALTAALSLSKALTYHQFSLKLIVVPIQDKQVGEQKKQRNREVCKIKLKVFKNEESIAKAEKMKGKFIIATNEMSQDALSNEILLDVYKGQSISVERGFRFLKDPMFFVPGFFIKKPGRVMALLMIMGLSLLVYALGEHHLRQRLAEQGCKFYDPVRGPTAKPTLKRIFQLLRGVCLVTLRTETGIREEVVNLQGAALMALRTLGAEWESAYKIPDHDR